MFYRRVRILPSYRLQREKRDYRPDNEQTEPETMTVTGQWKRCPFLFYTRALPKLLDKYNNELIATDKRLGEMKIGVEQSKR